MPHHARLLALALAASSLAAAHVAPAQAATLPWHVAETATLYDGSSRVIDATVAFAAGRAPRVALTTLDNPGFAMRVAVRDADGGWRVLPVPNGILVSGPADVALAAPPARQVAGAPWSLATLVGGTFAAPTFFPVPQAGARPVVPFGDHPRAIVYADDGSYALSTLSGDRWRTKTIAGPNAFPPLFAVGDDGAAWIFAIARERLQVSRPGASARFSVAQAANVVPGVDPRGRPVAAVFSTSGRTLTLVDGALRRGTHTLPKDVTVADERRCLAAPCRVVTHSGNLEAVLPFADGVAAIYALVTREAQRTCAPFVGEMHPCDPAGPVNTCPERPEFTCTDAGVDRYEPHLAWLAGGTVRDASLAALLGWNRAAPAARRPSGDVPQRVLGAATDRDGGVHLVVAEAHGRGTRVRWYRLAPGAGPAAAAVQPAVTPWRSLLDVVPRDDAQLAYAGLFRLESAGELRAVPGGVETGGEGRGVLWGAELDGLDPKRAAVVTVELTLPEGQPCGDPGIQLFHGDSGAAVSFTAEGLVLFDRFKLTPQTIPGRLVGRHRVALQVATGRAELFVDGARVAALELMTSAGPRANEHARIGHNATCPVPGAPIVWHQLAIGAGALAP